MDPNTQTCRYTPKHGKRHINKKDLSTNKVFRHILAQEGYANDIKVIKHVIKQEKTRKSYKTYQKANKHARKAKNHVSKKKNAIRIKWVQMVAKKLHLHL